MLNSFLFKFAVRETFTKSSTISPFVSDIAMGASWMLTHFNSFCCAVSGYRAIELYFELGIAEGFWWYPQYLHTLVLFHMQVIYFSAIYVRMPTHRMHLYVHLQPHSQRRISCSALPSDVATAPLHRPAEQAACCIVSCTYSSDVLAGENVL